MEDEERKDVPVGKQRINSRILERIQELSKRCEGGNFRHIKLDRHGGDTDIHRPGGRERPDYMADAGNARLNVWRINHRMLMFGQCWNNSTENMSKRNNTGELMSFLDNNYVGRYMVWCFTDNFKEKHNVQRIPLVDFDLGLAHRISCSVKCWLDISPNNVAVFEIKNGEEDKIRFLVSCVLRYCGFVDGIGVSNEHIMERIFDPPAHGISVVRRYIRYFDLATDFKPEERRHPIALKQLIMTTVPHAAVGGFLVGMKVMRRGEELLKIREDSDQRVYRDEHYVVFSDMDCALSDDVQILVYYDRGGKEEYVTRLRINSSFYEQGLYRFALDDVERLLPRHEYYHRDFSIDLVILECSGAPVKQLHLHKKDPVQGLRVLVEGFSRELNREIYERLVEGGGNEMIAKFCSFMEYDTETADEVIRSLETQGIKNTSVEARPLSATNISFNNRTEQSEERTMEDPTDVQPNAEPETMVGRGALYSKSCMEIRQLTPIREDPVASDIRKVSVKRMVPRKKEAPKDSELPRIVVRKPLHWAPLMHTGDTIFDEMAEVDAEIDYGKFEEMFCEPLAREESHIYRRDRSKGVIASGRLFLVSLSLKHLELKNITPENICSLVRSPDSPLGLQDLLNVDRVYPNHEETMGLTTTAPEALGSIERTMLAYSRLADVRKVVEILIFERRFFDEIFLIENVLRNISKLYTSILGSSSLRTVLKVVLEIGNAVNFRYSTNRRKARGFRLSSLYVFNSYRGKNDTSLFPFLLHTLEANNVVVEDLFRELAPIHGLKNEELSKICEKINFFIETYTEKVDLLNSLGDDVKDEYIGFLGFACSKLGEVSNMFRECRLHAGLVRRRFGEDENKSPNEVLVVLSDFLYNMEQSLVLHGRA